MKQLYCPIIKSYSVIKLLDLISQSPFVLHECQKLNNMKTNKHLLLKPISSSHGLISGFCKLITILQGSIFLNKLLPTGNIHPPFGHLPIFCCISNIWGSEERLWFRVTMNWKKSKPFLNVLKYRKWFFKLVLWRTYYQNVSIWYRLSNSTTTKLKMNKEEWRE